MPDVGSIEGVAALVEANVIIAWEDILIFSKKEDEKFYLHSINRQGITIPPKIFTAKV